MRHTARRILRALSVPILTCGAAGQDLEFFVFCNLDDSLYRVQADPFETELVGKTRQAANVAILRPRHLLLAAAVDDSVAIVRTTDGAILRVVFLDRPLVVRTRGIDVGPGGIVYGIFVGKEIRSIDLRTGETSLVSVYSGVNRIEAIAFTPDGTLYAAGTPANSPASDRLYRLDLPSGVATFIASLPIADVDGLTGASDGLLYGGDANGQPADLYRIDPSDGTTISLGVVESPSMNGVASVQCAADLTGASNKNDPRYGVRDFSVDSVDFFYFLDQFASGNLDDADLTGSSNPFDPDWGIPNGVIDADDFFFYLDLFAVGC